MELLEYENRREQLITQKRGQFLSCHDRASCSRCFPYWKFDIKHPGFEQNQYDSTCEHEIYCETLFYVDDMIRTTLFDLGKSNRVISQTKEVKRKGKKHDDGFWHLFITFTPNPSKDTNQTMIEKAERFINKSGIKQYKYCYEYMESIKIVHVHFYIKVDNLKHFGPSEILAFNGARVDFQHVQSSSHVSSYISKMETKVPPSDIGGRNPVVQSPNWTDN